jgi:hypothetical protein
VAALIKQLQDHALLWRHPQAIVDEEKLARGLLFHFVYFFRRGHQERELRSSKTKGDSLDDLLRIPIGARSIG